jgi:hypothetical protein
MTIKQWPSDSQFNDWWNAGVNGEDNPYVEDTRAYWAWEGWLAGRKAEREACAQIAFNANTYLEAAAAIRARGEE